MPPEPKISLGKRYRTLRPMGVCRWSQFSAWKKQRGEVPAGTILRPWGHSTASDVPTVWVTVGDESAKHRSEDFVTLEDLLTGCEFCAEQFNIPEKAPPAPIAMAEPAAPPLRNFKPVTRCWKLPNGNFLVQGTSHPWPTSDVRAVRLPGGTEMTFWHMYSERTPEGEKSFFNGQPQVVSDEDYLRIYDIHAVTGDELVEYAWWSHHSSAGYREHIEPKAVKLRGLVECEEQDLPFMMNGPQRARWKRERERSASFLGRLAAGFRWFLGHGQ